jgi:hypothetical protein
VKIDAVQTLLSLFVHQAKMRKPAPVDERETAQGASLLAETQDIRARLRVLEQLLREHHLIAETLGTPPVDDDALVSRMASATVDEVNRQLQHQSARAWERLDHDPLDGVTRLLNDYRILPPGQAEIAHGVVAERFEPSTEDIEHAVQLMGAVGLSPFDRKIMQAELAQEAELLQHEKSKVLMIALGVAVTIAVLAMAF